MTHQEKADCFGTCEIVDFGKVKTDLELFNDAFSKSETVKKLIREDMIAQASDSDEWSNSSGSE